MMQVETNSLYKSTYELSQKQPVVKEEIIESSSDETYKEPKTLKNMSLEEIQFYLQNNNIFDDSNNNIAKALFEIQKFANKVDSSTYNKMTTAILEEENASQANMRLATFPSEKMLDENPTMFHAMLDKTLNEKDTVRSLIFTLDFKQDFAQHQGIESKDELNFDFSTNTFIEFLTKKVKELEKNAQDGISTQEDRRIKDYYDLLNNYNKLLEEENTKVSILV